MSEQIENSPRIESLIPQRKPFLFLDQVIEHNKTQITAGFTFKENLDFFQGHFPGRPIVPGVILNEACFQSAAALIGINERSVDQQQGEANLAVVSRIQNAKFRNMVFPNDTITIKTEIVERFDNAAYFKSQVTNQENKKILSIEFTCTLIKEK